MKTYTLSFAAAREHHPEHPERTAKKPGTGMNFDITFRVFPNRPAMLKAIQIQERARPYQAGDWKAVLENFQIPEKESK